LRWGGNRPLGAVEVEATWVSRQAAMGNEALRLAFKVSDEECWYEDRL
jgi:hypothetical protein